MRPLKNVKFNRQTYQNFLLGQVALPPDLLRKAVMEQFMKRLKQEYKIQENKNDIFCAQ
jgi:hypothetical protein